MRSSTGTLMCLGSGAAFGAMAIFGKLAYDDGATVGTLLAVRFALAAVLFWALVVAGGALREVRAVSARDTGIALAMGACGYSLQAG
jgi:drug/metabolite transporter (DMT)-like permease